MIGRCGIEGAAMIEAIAWGTATGVLFLLVAGLRRLPWPYAGLLALGCGTVFSALRLSQLNLVDSGSLILLAALGGSLASTGWERGMRERARRSSLILGARPPALLP